MSKNAHSAGPGKDSPMIHAVREKIDAQTHLDVLQEMHWDTHIDKTDVRVQMSGEGVTLTGIAASLAGVQGQTGSFPSDPVSGLSSGSIFICFPEQGGAGSTKEVQAVIDGKSERGRTSCDGEDCRAEAQQVDGWLFVGDDGEQRHYCRACLARCLEGLRGQAVPEVMDKRPAGVWPDHPPRLTADG